MDGNIGSNLENATTPGEGCMGEKKQTWSLVTKIAHFSLDIFMIFSTGVFLRRSYLIRFHYNIKILVYLNFIFVPKISQLREKAKRVNLLISNFCFDFLVINAIA